MCVRGGGALCVCDTEAPYPTLEAQMSGRDGHSWWPHTVLTLVIQAVMAIRGGHTQF